MIFIRNITENEISRKLCVCLPPNFHREQSQEFTMFGGLHPIIKVKSQLTNVKYFPKIEVILQPKDGYFVDLHGYRL